MDCQSCESQIDPKWKYATESNICPFCGQQIMSEELRGLLSSLRDIMDTAVNNGHNIPIMDWLYSNCDLIHKNNAKQFLTEEDKQEYINIGIKQAKEEFKNSVFVKKTEQDDENKIPDEGIIVDKSPDERTSGFLQRAGIATNGDESIAEKTQRLKSERKNAHRSIKDLVNQIQSGDESSLTVQEPMETVNLYPDEENILDISLDNEDVPPHVLALAAAGSSSGSNVNMKDLLTLQRIKGKKRSSFNRDGKNGFSRS